MENNEELVTNVTENVEEQTTEEIVDGGTEEVVTDAEPVKTPKTYTDAEVDEIVKNRLGRQERTLTRKFNKELSNYKEAELVLNAGLGTSSIKEATEQMKGFYTQKGVNIPKYEPSYNEYDMEAGAEKEANSIIKLGLEEVIEEVDRLFEIGVDNMTPREKKIFHQLATYRQAEESKQELAKIGVSEKALEDKDYIDFAKNLNPNMSVKEKYEFYLKSKPKPEVTPMGSMKGTKSEESAVKDFYSYEEAMKFTKADFDNNPALYKAVEKSMAKWK